MNLKHKLYIFDFDGTLADTMGIWKIVTPTFLDRYNIKPTDEQYDNMSMLNYEEVGVFFREVLHVPLSAEQLAKTWDEFIVELFDSRAALKDGAREVLAALKASGAKIVLFTLSSRALVKRLMERWDIFHFFDEIFIAEEFMYDKGDPRSFAEIMRRHNASPDETAVIEDSFYACKSANMAGAFTYAIEDEHTGEKSREKMRAIAGKNIKSLSELLD